MGLIGRAFGRMHLGLRAEKICDSILLTGFPHKMPWILLFTNSQSEVLPTTPHLGNTVHGVWKEILDTLHLSRGNTAIWKIRGERKSLLIAVVSSTFFSWLRQSFGAENLFKSPCFWLLLWLFTSYRIQQCRRK